MNDFFQFFEENTIQDPQFIEDKLKTFCNNLETAIFHLEDLHDPEKLEQTQIFTSFFMERNIDSKIDFFRNQESIVCLLNMISIHRLLGSNDKV
jgi:hypothetical protein